MGGSKRPTNVQGLALLPNATNFVSAGYEDATVKLWDLRMMPGAPASRVEARVAPSVGTEVRRPGGSAAVTNTTLDPTGEGLGGNRGVLHGVIAV